MPPASAARRRPPSIPGYLATTGTKAGADRPGRSSRTPLAAHIDDFLTDLANANKPRNTIRAYRGDLVAFAAHHDGEIGGITAALLFRSSAQGSTPHGRGVVSHRVPAGRTCNCARCTARWWNT